jgi:putative tryptophan/tyrosine transport system substrate-binding protein
MTPNRRVKVRERLSLTGYVEGRNLTIEYRWADYQFDRLPVLAASLVQRPVAVIFATGGVVSAIAAKSATTTIPIVFAQGSDPIRYGLVSSLNRPGDNVTGVTFYNSALGPKRIGLSGAPPDRPSIHYLERGSPMRNRTREI